MNKKAILPAIFNIFTLIFIIILIVLFVLVTMFGQKTYEACTSEYKQVDNYIKVGDLEIGERVEKGNQVCYTTNDLEAYEKIVELTNDLELKKHLADIEQEERESLRFWESFENNKYLVFITILILGLFLIWMKNKDKN